MKTCETCRYMAEPRDKAWREHEPSANHRTCVRIIHGNGSPPNYPWLGRGDDSPEYDGDARKELAAVLDGSGYAARLVVLPSFGCVLHKERAAS
jgi:hypothetical protein